MPSTSTQASNSSLNFFASPGNWRWGVIVSVLLLVPCFWHKHIAAGDLGSHVYNAWLAQLVEQGKAPGLYLVWQWQNVLFDLLLFYSTKWLGFALGEKLAVGLVVLVFFWGVFALVRAVTGKHPWFLAPLIAMVSYGYVFHMGFFNFYLSVGLACWGLSLVWRGGVRRMVVALLLAPLMLLAHPIGALWFAGTSAYILFWRRLGRGSWIVFVGAIAAAVAMHLYLQHQTAWEVIWPGQHFYQLNGADQLVVFGRAWRILAVAIFGAGILLLGVERLVAARKFPEWWKANRLLLELYAVAFVTVAMLPQDLKTAPGNGWIGVLANRMTITASIFVLCLLGTLHLRKLAGLVFVLGAVLYFSLLYRETRFVNRLEDNAAALAQELPYGTRVLKTVWAPVSWRMPYLHHVVERACIGKCFVYSNYEPITRQFRIRVQEGSPIAVADVDDGEAMDGGEYEVQEEDLPLKEIYQCDARDLTKLCIRDLAAGEKNGRIGYRPIPQE